MNVDLHLRSREKISAEQQSTQILVIRRCIHTLKNSISAIVPNAIRKYLRLRFSQVIVSSLVLMACLGKSDMLSAEI